MRELIIYHVIDEPLEDVVANFCNTLFQQNLRAMLIFNSDELLHNCDKRIWTFASEKFIPHGTIFDTFPVEMQSFYLTNASDKFYNFTHISFIFPQDSIQEYINTITSTNFTDNITKIACIFTGIQPSEEYIKEIQSSEKFKQLFTCKFFQRMSGVWNKISEF